MLCEKEHHKVSKSIDSCQPVRTAQADMNRNFALRVNFLRVLRTKSATNKQMNKCMAEI